MFGSRHVLFRFRLTGGYSHTGNFDLVADMRREVGGGRYHADRLWPVAFHIGEHIAVGFGALLQTSRQTMLSGSFLLQGAYRERKCSNQDRDHEIFHTILLPT